jgi:cytidine deaminase
MDLKEAIEIAKDVRKNVYSPYGKYYVGAALKCGSRENLFWM